MYIVVNTEEDALLLENNLIKKYKPRYNILLKDDKTYPWICITKEAFPRVFTTRKFIRNGSEYFGPYTSAKYANTLISLIKSLYKLRTCNLSLNKSAVYSGKYKVCLEYHIGNCMGPCVGYVQEEEYMELFLHAPKTPICSGKTAYIRKNYHERIQRIVHLIVKNWISLSIYMDRVLEQHFREKEEVIRRLYNKNYEDVY